MNRGLLDETHHIESVMRTAAVMGGAPGSSRKKRPGKICRAADIDASALFSALCILQSTNRIWHLARSLVGVAFSFQLLIAEGLSGGHFNGSLGLLCRTFDSILIHVISSLFGGDADDNDFIDVLFRHDNEDRRQSLFRLALLNF